MVTIRDEQVAFQMLYEEIHRRACVGEQQISRSDIMLQASPVSWLLPRVLRLFMEHHARPVDEFAPIVRRMLNEQVYANVGGDCTDCQALDDSLDDAVESIIIVLRKMREQIPESPYVNADSGGP